MKFEIKSRFTGATLFSLETESRRLCVEAAVKAKADLRGADLRGANLYGVKNAQLALAMTMICPQGEIVGWKKAIANGKQIIVKLRIPTEAKRSNATGRKCRAEFADVLEIDGADVAHSDHDSNFEYRVGQRVVPDSFDDDRWDECSHGIHFFITREEAEGYSP